MVSGLAEKIIPAAILRLIVIRHCHGPPFISACASIGKLAGDMGINFTVLMELCPLWYMKDNFQGANKTESFTCSSVRPGLIACNQSLMLSVFRLGIVPSQFNRSAAIAGCYQEITP